MPKIVCVKCQCELRPETNETTVIEMAQFGVYKVWNADTLKCPGCGIEVVSGFGDHPVREDHYAPDFISWLRERVRVARRIVYDYEKPQEAPHA